ncbi:MurR/RpiR family transcriptional regulator [Mesobacillus foraminis]|uniref:MurR/RpiR family transcriptional regulator n=1 Tax=Mesobacillus foraminis TaxID=279826 RepID=UPI000EF54128|nr:MurR/RpiR family transcriptional regulator [Mesobacillus foraminis]
MEEKTLFHIIKERFPSLSPGQKKVAEFIKRHMDEGALQTAYQIGQKVGVSETTVIRLAYALGFGGFSDLQEKIRKDWLFKQQAENEVTVAGKDRDVPIFERIIDRERVLLDQLLPQLNPEDLWKAVESIIEADRVYIGSIGSTYAAGYWLYYSLRQMRKDVFLSSPNGYLPEEICELTRKSVVVVFSYPRYRREVLKLVNLAKNQHAKILAITNRQLSPAGQAADIALTTEEQTDFSHNSIASVISLLEVLIAGIQSRDEERINLRQQQLEQLYANQELFLE